MQSSTKPATCQSWDFHSKDGFYIRPALHHYRCFHLLKADNGHTVFSDTVEFRHSFLTTATPSTDDCLLHALHMLTAVLSDEPQITSDHQLMAIADLLTMASQDPTSKGDARTAPYATTAPEHTLSCLT